jgi:hypothetical protein
MFRTTCVSLPTKLVFGKRTEDAMKRIVIITATLLVSTLGAQAASQKASYHPAYRSVASNSAGIGDPLTAAMPPGFRAVFDDAINDIRRSSAHPAVHGSACLARQSQLADDIERLVPSAPVDVRQNPTMIELRTRCMPINPNPPV